MAAQVVCGASDGTLANLMYGNFASNLQNAVSASNSSLYRPTAWKVSMLNYKLNCVSISMEMC